MQSDSNPGPESEYVPRDDESEAERMPNTHLSAEGFGEILTDEDVKNYSLRDFDSFGPMLREYVE